MGALGHFIEREGIATAQISLIREQTAAIKPPRALWVPFMLGRPFGAPNAPDFQRKVLRALLALFTRPSGPVLEDFPEDAPVASVGETTFACPVSFAQPDSDSGDVVDSMVREITQLAPWYELARKRRGRTTVGISKLTMEQAAEFAASYAGDSPASAYDANLSAGVALKRACDDLKTYHYEAAAAQPGNLSPQE
ncbi:MAG: selenoprotein B, partial [Betaproteobacteria bacterium]